MSWEQDKEDDVASHDPNVSSILISSFTWMTEVRAEAFRFSCVWQIWKTFTFTMKSPKSIRTKGQFKQHFFICQWIKLAKCGSPGQRHLKLLELLLGSSSFCYFEHVEPHGFAEWSAFSNSHNVSNCDISAEEKSRFSDCDSIVPD